MARSSGFGSPHKCLGSDCHKYPFGFGLVAHTLGLAPLLWDLRSCFLQVTPSRFWHRIPYLLRMRSPEGF